MEKEHHWQGQQFEAEISETDTSFTARIAYGDEVVLFTYSPPGKVEVMFNPAPLPTPEQAAEPEKPKTVKLRGRIGTEIRRKPSPTGGTMAVFSFAEHPNRAVWSYSNTLAEKTEKDTVWWAVVAFDEDVQLLDSASKGKEYDIECFANNVWKETKEGREITVTGLRLVGIQPFRKRTNKQLPT